MATGRLGFPLYFNHVPKCAGTSVNEVLARALSVEQIGVEPFVSATELYTMQRAALDRLVLVGSHFPHWAAMRRLQGWSTLTVLREPWARFQALSRHLLRIAGSEPHALSPSQSIYVTLLRQSRFAEALRQAASWYPWNSSMVSCFVPDAPDENQPLAAAAAIDAVEQYDLVLLAEHLDAESILVDQTLNAQSFGVVAHLNTSREYGDAATGPFPDAMRDAYDAQFPYERELYEAGARRSGVSVTAMRSHGHRAGGVRTQEPSLYLLDWDRPTRCGGFSDRVRASSFGYDGRFARRVEARKAVLEFDVPQICEARLEAVFWVAPAEGRFDCRLLVNGREVALFEPAGEVACPVDPSQLWTSGELPAAALGDGHCVLEIDRSAASLRELWLLDLAVRRARAPA